MNDFKKYELFALKIAKSAGKMLFDGFGSVNILAYKDKQDFLTDLDKKIEDFVIKKIISKYPSHSILSEESKPLDKQSDFRWIIDPVDGTKHVVKDIPMFSFSIALEFKGELVVGVIMDPFSNRLYHASIGNGAYINDKKIHVNNETRLDHAFVYVDISKIHSLPKYEKDHALDRLNKIVLGTFRLRALGLGTFGMCYLANGGYDAYFDLTGKTKIMDVAAGIVITRESGAMVGYIDSKNPKLLSANPVLYKKLSALLK